MKSIRPEIISASNGLPGHGVLVLLGLQMDAVDPFGQIEILVQRNQDSRFLALEGEWSASQTWHHVDRAISADEHLELILGPGVIDPLVKNTQMTYLLQVRCGEMAAQGVLRIRDGVLSSHASGTSIDPVARVSARVATAADPIVVPIEQDPPETAPAAPLVAPHKKPSHLIWILLGVLLIAAIAGYFIWMALKPSATSTPSTGQSAAPVASSTATPAAPAAPAPCSAEALAATKDDLVFLQECLKTNPETAQVLAVIHSAKTAKRCDLVQRLYAFKSQAGDVAVALAYAREFDPQFHQPGCFASPDKATAVYWYELVLSKQADHTDAKARLDALKN